MDLSHLAHRITLIALLFSFGTCLGQGTTDEQLAAHYYQEGDFEKAALYYEKLYEERQSDDVYNYYLSCLLSLENYKAAEKLCERQSKANPKVLRYQADIGRVMERSGDAGKADKHFDRLIRDLDKASVNQILDLGRAFSEMNANDRALETYYAGRKQMGNSYPFHFQIAQVLGEKGDVAGMIGEYLDVLEVSKGYLQSVQNTLNRVIGFDEENKYNAVLEEELMRRVQRNPNDEIYAEMLIWMYVQQNRYDAAMNQVVAIDKRNREDGERVMTLSKSALKNNQFGVAINGFEYVKTKGKDGYYYLDAVTGSLQAKNAKITHSNYDASTIKQLDVAYQATLDEFGKRATTWEIIKDYAHVLAYYQSKYDQTATSKATKLLEASLSIPGLNDLQLAELKLELANIYVTGNKIWDASLLYGQIEKKFKYDEIGFQAKLNNAKVFYYAGDFGWSEAQLNALKGSTSKLISNDAIELSAFISENTGLDTTTAALALYAKSELMLAQHKYDSALFLLQEIEKNHPGHTLTDNLLFQRASIAFERNDFDSAAVLFMKVAEDYSFDKLADNALMEAGRIYEERLNRPQDAMDVYERILSDYTSSLFVVEARKRFRALRGDTFP